MRQRQNYARIVRCTYGVVDCTSYGGCNFRGEKSWYDYRIASFLSRSKEFKTLRVALLMMIGRTHEHAGIMV
jgi:hypothetical protein